MSADSTIEALEVMDRGFTITKQVSRKGGEHIQINLEITSTHDDQSTIDIEETVPDGTDQSQIGFLPDKEPDEWAVTDDGTLIFTANLVAGGTRQIVYGVKDIDDDNIDVLASEPELTAISGPVTEAIEEEYGDEEDDPEDAPADTAEDAPADTHADADAPAAAAATGTDGGQAEAVGADGTGTIELPLDDDSAAALADQLAPHLSESEMDAVTETKLSQLQDDVADIRAYLPAFEEFLGDAGRADDIVEELEELREEIAAVEGVPEGLEETIDGMEAQLESIEETAQQQEELLEEVTDRLDNLEGWREDIATASSPSE